MKKLISFVIPCYNSASYMQHALDTIITGGSALEIIIVNDGSSDDTLKIAKHYEKKYSDIIKVIDKENGGHGSGINIGLKIAQGKYFKVVDSDDWVDIESLKKVLLTLKKIDVELFIVNYVYEKEGKSKVMSYSNLPQNKIFGWEDIKKFGLSSYLLMHSVIYKTEILKKCKLTLPEHTFYVDNIFVYYPLTFVKKMYYLDVPFYRYFIGREDQSVNENVMIKRIEQQLYVTKTMIDFFNPLTLENKNLREYLLHYLDIMISISTILLKIENTEASKVKVKDLWSYLDKKDIRIKKYLTVARATKLPRFICVPIYKIVRKVYKFN